MILTAERQFLRWDDDWAWFDADDQQGGYTLFGTQRKMGPMTEQQWDEVQMHHGTMEFAKKELRQNLQDLGQAWDSNRTAALDQITISIDTGLGRETLFDRLRDIQHLPGISWDSQDPQTIDLYTKKVHVYGSERQQQEFTQFLDWLGQSGYSWTP